MKKIGLIAGMSWQSSSVYYQIINQKVQQKMGGLHSCECIMYSVDFDEIAQLQHNSDWVRLSYKMVQAAKALERAGADIVLICTNTMHKVAEDIEKHIAIPLLHIVDSTAQAIASHSIKKLAFLGTKFSMEEDFLKKRFRDKFGIEVVIPDEKDRGFIHDIIYQELVKGVTRLESKIKYVEIIEKMLKQEIQGVISGCTEIELLIHPEDITIPLFATTKIHAEAAVEYALLDM